MMTSPFVNYLISVGFVWASVGCIMVLHHKPLFFILQDFFESLKNNKKTLKKHSKICYNIGEQLMEKWWQI